jgi:lipopolysaccharide export system ATP-binding protein
LVYCHGIAASACQTLPRATPKRYETIIARGKEHVAKLFSFGFKSPPAALRPAPAAAMTTQRTSTAAPHNRTAQPPGPYSPAYPSGTPDPQTHSRVLLPAPRHGEGWLTVQGVQKAFKKRRVVKGVSLDLNRGEAVGLLGPNGAGKTTVFYMITGLIPSDTGTILIDGKDVTALPMYRRARLGIGYLPQEASIFRGLTVEQNIMAILEIVEPSRKKRREKLDNLLDEFNIGRLRKSPSIALSGGERRRCEIARALASNPSYMLLDEPFAGVDPIAVGDIQDLVRHLTGRGIGVLITDHNVRETLKLTDRAYVIYDGQVLTQGKPQEIINNEDVRRVYLGDSFV